MLKTTKYMKYIKENGEEVYILRLHESKRIHTKR